MVTHRIQPPNDGRGALIGRCFVCGERAVSKDDECIVEAPKAPLDVIQRETWWHEEHTRSIRVGDGDGSRIAQFEELDEHLQGSYARRHRAHVAACAPEFARALRKLITAVTTFPGGFDDRQIAEALDESVKVLQKAGAMVKP